MMVRDAVPADALQLWALIARHAAFEQSALSLDIETLDGLLAQPKPPTRLVVADDGANLAGYAALTIDYSLWGGCRFGHLDCLFVDEARRGHGIGRQLLDHARAMLVEAGLTRMEWQTPEWNDRAARFYLREGATAQKKLRFSLGIS